MDAKNRQVDLLIGRSLISAEAIAQELRARLIKRLAKMHGTLDSNRLLKMARDLLAEFEPLLAGNLYDSEVAAWIIGVDFAAKRLPKWARDRIAGANFDGGKPPTHKQLLYPGDDKPIVRFPLIEKAAESLANKRVVSREEFEQLSAEAKTQSFTVASVNSDAALAKIRDTLAELIETGPTLRVFRERMADVIETSAIGPGRTELIYRQNIQRSYSEGMDQLANNPIVQEVFPFAEYLPIRDARCRPEHRELGGLGLSGTGVYWASDPFWMVFQIPWDFGCRCGKNLLTAEAAARKGVAVAREWLRTGKKPSMESRLPEIPFRPPPGFGRAAVAA